MVGVKGSGGPPPKRSDQRRRRNPPAKGHPEKAPGAAKVRVPRPDPSWHPVARRWYESLRRSGQAVFYQDSDWATAYTLAETISRELNPQPVVTKDGEVLMVSMPVKSATIAAFLKGATALLTTEGDRRRAALELERPKDVGDEEQTGEVRWLDDARNRLRGVESG